MSEEGLFSIPPENLLPHHGEVYYYPRIFSQEESELLFSTLYEALHWKQEPVKIFGKEIMQPRLTAWYADEGISYSYSGITMQPMNWTAELVDIKNRVEAIAGLTFNSALLNLYRNGNDSMGWHRDNEKELGLNPVIASVSFGGSRKFQLRTYKDKSELRTFNLESGSCLLMRGETQPFWEHRVPKTLSAVEARINITFRQVKGGGDRNKLL